MKRILMLAGDYTEDYEVMAADVLKGKKVTAYPAVKPEVLAAGGIFVEKEPHEAVVYENLVTSPAWPGKVEILKGFLTLLGMDKR